MKAKVSIVIPVYNQGHFLGRAIQSALEQTERALEVVVVNDGSTDNTRAVAQSFRKDPRLKYIEQPNAGLPAARNRGFAECTGEYVCFLDADDFYHPDKIGKQVALLDADPGVGFVYCDLTVVDEAGNVSSEQYSVADRQTPLSGNLFNTLMLGGYFPPHTVMVRRSVLEEVGLFDPELGGHADYELWLRISGAGFRAYYHHEKLVYYRNHPNSMSKDGLRMNETRAATFRKLTKMYPRALADSIHHLQRTNRDFYDANVWLQQQLQSLYQQVPQLQFEVECLRQQNAALQESLKLFTEGGAPPQWVQSAFQKTVPRKLRRSIRKRLNTLRYCFDDAQAAGPKPELAAIPEALAPVENQAEETLPKPEPARERKKPVPAGTKLVTVAVNQ